MTSTQRDELRGLHQRYVETRDERERAELRERLVQAYSGLVHSIARKFANRQEPLEDIVQVGFLGLIKAIDRFDPEFGTEFSTFATPTITGEIKRYFRDRSWSIRFPRRLQELYGSVLQANEKLKGELGRQPSLQEVADSLQVPLDDVLEAMEIGAAMAPVSLDSEVGGTEDGRPLAEVVGDTDENLERVELQDALRRAMSHLNERERKVMAMRFYEQLSQAEVARNLGISQMHVSRLQRAALEQLKQYLPSDLA